MNIAADVRQACVNHRVLGPGQFLAEFEFLPDLEIFRGHFPGQAVVPGVYLLQCLLAAASQGSGREPDARHLRKAKFFRLVQPPCRVQAEVTLLHQANGLEVQGEIRVQGQIAAMAVWEGA
jgi:3-hydroxymyristoyl/3-hydroxydecanoyl-(acyl carrier protein) dehydratase